MDRLHLTDLAALLRDAAGSDEGTPLDEGARHTPFLDLGYDSLALLQVTGVIEREYRVTLDEEALDEAQTPHQYLTLVNGAPTARPAA